MIAGAFAYYNYRFSQYNFIDFSQWNFYEKSDVFTPNSERYRVLLYSSNMNDIKEILALLKPSDMPTLCIDIHQANRQNPHENTHFVSAGINTLLPLIHRFHIFRLPSVFVIERFKKSTYKQISSIEQIIL